MRLTPFAVGVSLKMYFSHAGTLSWTREIADLCAGHRATRDGLVEFFVIPTFPSIPAVIALAPRLTVGAQDAAAEDWGPFTGEVSAAELAEIGCRLVEVGHAERRRLFGENRAVVAAKTRAVLRNGLTPIVCVGDERRGDPGTTVAECVRQLGDAVRPARAAQLDAPVIAAYEPHWAIGADRPADPDFIRTVCRGISDACATESALAGTRVLYGGSAGPGLLPGIADSVDGLFLGRFAHEPRAVETILDEALVALGSA